MVVVGSLGFLIFFVALFYIPYFFIAKLRNKEKAFQKKKFFTVLISGFLVFVVGFALDDVFQVSAIQEENRALTEDVNQLNVEMDNLNEKLVKLETEIESITKENISLQKDLEEVSKENKELKAKNEELTKEIEKQKKTISDLEKENKKLKEQKTAASAKSSNNTQSASSSGKSSSSTNKSTTQTSNKTTTQTSNKSSQSSGNVHYKNCTEAREAGVTPIYKGEPGYAKHLDRDGDGIACE